jgi:hypothetical protein
MAMEAPHDWSGNCKLFPPSNPAARTDASQFPRRFSDTIEFFKLKSLDPEGEKLKAGPTSLSAIVLFSNCTSDPSSAEPFVAEFLAKRVLLNCER